MSLRTSVPRYEFVNDVEPNWASEPNMCITCVIGNMSRQKEKDVHRYYFVNDVEPKWASGPDIHGVSGDMKLVGKADAVSDVENAIGGR